VCVCVSGHNSGTPGAISTKLGTHLTISISIKMDVCVYVCVCVCVCAFVCLGITLERLGRFQPNLVHILLYVCVLYILQGGWCGRQGIWMIHIVQEINLSLLYNLSYI
jgi:hypothetical protein